MHEALQSRPLASTTSLRASTRRTTPTVLQALDVLQRLGVVHEITGRRRNRVFAYSRYLELLNRES